MSLNIFTLKISIQLKIKLNIGGNFRFVQVWVFKYSSKGMFKYDDFVVIMINLNQHW